jgi:hypothetical protein
MKTPSIRSLMVILRSLLSNWALSAAIALYAAALTACATDEFTRRSPEEVPPIDECVGDECGEPDSIEVPEACMFYAIDDQSSLWTIDAIESVPVATLVGDTGIQSLTDISLHPNGKIIGHTRKEFFSLSPATGVATLLEGNQQSVEDLGPVASDALSDTEVLVGGEHAIGIMDIESKVFESYGNVLPNDWEFAGDIAVLDANHAYATAKKDEENDHLFLIDVQNRTAEDLGSLETDLVWGLDYGCDGKLYGLVSRKSQSTDPLRLILINPDTMDLTDRGIITGPSKLVGAAGPK